jgi:hypothetical protein
MKEIDESEANKLKHLEMRKQADIERFFNLPSQQADFQYWAKADYWTADEAVALSFGRNPKAVNWKVIYEYTLISPFAQEYEKRLKLIRRAFKSEALKKSIAPIQFLHWFDIKEIICPDELVTLVRRYDTSEGTMDSKAIAEIFEKEKCEEETCDSSIFQEDQKNPFDSLPTSGIAKIFTLNLDPNINLTTWIQYARDAKKNGLVVARVKSGKGRAESYFDPIKTGEWLILKGKMARKDVNKYLAANLPDRSKDLRDYFVQ